MSRKINRNKIQVLSRYPGRVDLVSELRFKECLLDAMVKVSRHGSDDAVKVASHWEDVVKDEGHWKKNLDAETNKVQ